MVNIPNYYQRAISLLASQFQIALPNGNMTNFQKMLYAILTQAQEIQTQENLLISMRSLTTAQGIQLDGLGQILGLARQAGQSDASYAEDLQFQVFINISSGTPEQMIYILKFLTDATKIWYSELYPAAYVMATNGLVFPANPSDLVGLIQSVSPAGVNFIGVIATYNTLPFSFSTDPINEQFYASLSVADVLSAHPFEVDPGSGAVDLYIQRGEVDNPQLGGGFAEAIGIYPNYTIDITNAGQMVEIFVTNGNIPPTN